MKISKIFAAMSAAALAASMVAIPASADTAYLYTVQSSWSGTSPADAVEGEIKWATNEDGTPKTAKGACDLNGWVSGDKYNGQWAQYILTSDDLSGVTLTFTLQTDDNSTWEYHETDPEKPEDNVYQTFLVLGKTETVNHDDINGSVVEEAPADADLVHADPQTFVYEYSGDDILAGIDAGKAQFAENGDGTYTLGMNIQVGHIYNAILTAEISGDNLYTGPVEGGDDSSAADESKADESKADDSKSDSKSDSKADSSSKASGGSTTTSKSSGGSTTTNKTQTTTSKAAASDATESSDTGAAAGVGLAIAALAGAAIVVSRRK